MFFQHGWNSLIVSLNKQFHCIGGRSYLSHPVPTIASIHGWSERACTAPGACVGKICPHLSPPNRFPLLCKKPEVCNKRLTKSHNSYSSVGEAREITDVTNFYDSRKWEKFPDYSRKWDDKWVRRGCGHICLCTEGQRGNSSSTISSWGHPWDEKLTCDFQKHLHSYPLVDCTGFVLKCSFPTLLRACCVIPHVFISYNW